MASRLNIRVRRGLDLPVQGAPRQEIGAAAAVRHVGIVGRDYPGMKLGPVVDVGDRVALGEPVLRDRGDARIVCTAPAGGVVTAINRGERRVLQSLVIRIEGDAEVTFDPYRRSDLPRIGRETITSQLCEAGLWPAFRARPYNHVAVPGAVPFAITVTAMDSNPLAADPMLAIGEAAEHFRDGVLVLSQLTDGMIYVCAAPGSPVPVPDTPHIIEADFAGPHPAGLPGTHIHMLCPAGAHRTVWHVGYQDVIAIGKLFTTGRLATDRVISLGGPMLRDPRVVRTRSGASLAELLEGELNAGELRLISGSLLAGAAVTSWGAYLGRYDNQVTVLPEGREREFLGWITPGSSKFSVSNAFLSALRRHLPFRFTTNQNGSPRAMVPIGIYEKVMPLDILPTPLLRALLVRDIESSIALGALELAEEDLSLCSFVCPSKHDFGPVLRSVLDEIHKEG